MDTQAAIDALTAGNFVALGKALDWDEIEHGNIHGEIIVGRIGGVVMLAGPTPDGDSLTVCQDLQHARALFRRAAMGLRVATAMHREQCPDHAGPMPAEPNPLIELVGRDVPDFPTGQYL
jgi:hypothetical protein